MFMNKTKANNTNKARIKTIACSLMAVFAVFLLVGCALYWQRKPIIERIAKDKLAKVEENRNVRISFKSMNIEGFDNLVIDAFNVQEPDDTTFLHIDRLDCKLNLLSLLHHEVVIDKLSLCGIHLNIIDQYKNKNFGFLLHVKHTNNGDSKLEKKTVFEKISDIMNKVFDVVPEDLKIRDMNVCLIHNNYRADFCIPEFNIIDNQFNSIARVKCLGSVDQQMRLSGSFTSRDHNINCNIASADTLLLQVPLIDSLFQANVKADSLLFSFRTTKEEHDNMQVAGKLGFNGLKIDYFRLSNRDLLFGNGSVDYVVNIHDDYFELDSSSVVRFNQMDFHPYVKAELRPTVKITASINKQTFESAKLFSSIPYGLFANLDSIQTTGDLDYHFYLKLDMDSIDSLKFESALNKHPNFRIVKFGKTDFREINKPFMYEARDHETLARTFMVGPSNPGFRPLDSISPYLQAAVMTSEDGFFYSHKGFYDGAFEYSLKQNIKQRRFARGGSTISMQLVKNVFLNNNKTLMRKLEEIMIVWLIENERLVSKRRLYEIYLNIIEWGPNHKVYGAEEAAKFYFSKHADQLTPDEAIFLATIVPSPKKFMYRFDETHKLRPYMESYFNMIGGKMHMRGFISDAERDSLSKDNVAITGDAIKWLPKLRIDAAVADSLSKDDDENDSLLKLDE